MLSPASIIRKICEAIFGLVGLAVFTYLFIFKFTFIEAPFFVNGAQNIASGLKMVGFECALTSVQYAMAGLCIGGLGFLGLCCQVYFDQLMDMLFPPEGEKTLEEKSN